jgi:LDH2 family malate/lactate/ureidoglycolate dehydrogenase
MDAGFIGLIFTNASASMPPWGGTRAILGTGPLAVGFPGGLRGPFLLDMSPSVAARGKIRKALRRREKIPEGYAFDSEGQPTTDPEKALQGVILPAGGPKGSGLAMMIDILSGILTGAAFAGGVGDQETNFDHPQNVGHFVMALRPNLFVPSVEFESRMDTLVERIHLCPTTNTSTEVLIPGEPEAREHVLRQKTGIPYHLTEIDRIQEEAARVNVPALIVAEKPLSEIGPAPL